MNVTEDFIKAMEVYRKPKEGQKFLEAASDNIMFFAERMLGMRPYSWQVSLLNKLQESIKNPNAKKEFLALTSRQIGKSTLVAIFSLWSTIFNKYPGGVFNNTSVLITSASDVQARKLLKDIKDLMRAGDTYMATEYLDADGQPQFTKTFFSGLLSETDPNNTTTVTFKPHNPEVHGLVLQGSRVGSVIKSYPPTSSVLGETASIVIIDEAGKTDKITDEFFYDYVYPVGNKNNAVRLYTSTPWVSNGFFFNMVDLDNKKLDKDKPQKVIFTIDDIKLEAPEYHKNIVENVVKAMEADGKTDEVQRAYYCRFVQGETSYFNPEKIAKCFEDKYEMVEEYTGPCDVGLDFGGQTTSKTVITITTLGEDGKMRRLYKKVYPVNQDLNVLADLKELKKRFNIQRIIPDDCPAGHYLIQEMVQLGWDIFPMSFATDKVKKYSNFRRDLNLGKIKSFVDPELKVEMLALEMIQGERTIKIKHAPNYSDDEIDSFVMSCYFYLVDDTGFKMFSMYDDDDEI